MSIFIVFLFGLLGGLAPLWLRNRKGFLEFSLPFSGAVLLGTAFVHIIPDSVEELGHDAGLFILLGFLIQLFLEKYSHGIEHGHSHIAGKYSSAVFWGLGLHALIEGIPLGYQFRDPSVHDHFTLSIVVHKIPEAFTLGVFFIHEAFKRSRYVSSMIVFALVTPLAAIFFGYLGESYLAISRILPHLVAVAIGSFLWISTTIFFESEGRKHDLKGIQLYAIILGFALVILTDFIGH